MVTGKRQVELAMARQEESMRFECVHVSAQRPQPGLAADIARGFAANPRSIPAKYFYDARGSELFDRICATEEYYPTRIEAALLARQASAIVERIAPDHIVELGSGAARKTRHLLTACQGRGLDVHYWPFDVCEQMLGEAAAALLADYPWLRLTALVGDYLAGLEALPQPPGRRLFVFLGGTLGNFEQGRALQFLRELRGLMRPDDALLLGVDRVKPAAVLQAAYNDAAGITARFNLNVLNVLNRELGADFDLDAFHHRALYNRQAERIEMYLVCSRGQRVTIPALGAQYCFAAGEPILTEISQKYSRYRLANLVKAAGLAERAHYQPANGYFSLLLLERKAQRR